MIISTRLFWFIVFVVVVIVLIGGWALFVRPRQLPPHERGRKVTDPREIQMLEHPELEYFQKQSRKSSPR
jgi:hypothetical protein